LLGSAYRLLIEKTVLLANTVSRFQIPGNFQTETGHAGHTAGSGQQAHFTDSEVLENLRADTMLAQIRQREAANLPLPPADAESAVD